MSVRFDEVPYVHHSFPNQLECIASEPTTTSHRHRSSSAPLLFRLFWHFCLRFFRCMGSLRGSSPTRRWRSIAGSRWPRSRILGAVPFLYLCLLLAVGTLVGTGACRAG